MIIINGKETFLQNTISVEEYLKKNNYQINRVVVELNESILPKADYSTTFFHEGDRVEILSFVGGG